MGSKGLKTYYQSKEIGIDNQAKKMVEQGKSKDQIIKYKNKALQDIKTEQRMDGYSKSSRTHRDSFSMPGEITSKPIKQIVDINNEKCFCGVDLINRKYSRIARYGINVQGKMVHLCESCYNKYHNTTIKQLKQYKQWLKNTIQQKSSTKNKKISTKE